MADWLQVQGLKNAIVDEMSRRADVTNSVPTPDDTRNIFGEGVEEEIGKLRELMLDLFVWYGDLYDLLLGDISLIDLQEEN